jgi:hypothetical protein
MLIEGKLPTKYLQHANNVKNYYFTKHVENTSESKHYWINSENAHIKQSLDILRNAPEIIETIQRTYPKFTIKPVHKSDEVYISVDPSLRKNSDIALSDCHYDAPFKYVYQCGNVFVRVILALTENSTTFTTIGTQKSLLSTLDFNGMDYNSDYHCVDGYIPKGKIRILLKLHFLCVHPNSPKYCANFTENINDWWTHYSRELMRRSVNPENIGDTLISYVILVVRTLYNKIDIRVIILIIVILILSQYKFKSSRYLKHT